MIFGYLDKIPQMIVALVAGAIAAAFLNIDKISSFKSAWFEAEMKRAVVEEVDVTTKALQRAVKPLISATLRTLTVANRYGGMDAGLKHALRNDLQDLAVELGLEDDVELKEAHEEFQRMHIWDSYDDFTRSVNSFSGIPMDVKTLLTDLTDRQSTNYPTREHIERILGVHLNDILLDEDRHLLDVYVRYSQTGRLSPPSGQGQRP